ncbi:serine/threonine-protein kinase [Acaryochloris sp. IP29b_bin.148]|uniref:serine/threonine-protein kinase n=1 Tax=Acaryochloris sp. IP29b_bin.148 TaxID=2969218 RepID=UPI002611C4E4|nr:serine/threonine-protein kinase [Acaryochloris sp. IP29b_bin.148]
MDVTLIKDQYQIIKPLAEGGFGITYLVEDTHRPSRRRCVLKQLKPVTQDPQVYQIVQDRFRQEAACLEKLGDENPQIPELYSYFQDGGYFYLAQEWVNGHTLAQWQQPVDAHVIMDVLQQTLPVLEDIHRQGIIHRDLKPDNMIWRQRDGKPVLIDFGAVKEVMGTQINTQGQTTTSIVIGTPGYMSAEQAAGRPVFSSDLYSLGLSMMVLLTGRLPTHLGSDPCTGELLWRQHAPGIDGVLADVLDRATRYHPRERFSSAREMLADLQRDPATVSPTQTASSSQTPTIQQPHSQASVSVPNFLRGWKGIVSAIALVGIGGLLLFRPGQPNTPVPMGGVSPKEDIDDSESTAPSIATPDPSGQASSSIVGTWKVEALTVMSITHYKKDGTWRGRITYANGLSQEYTGTWEYADGILLSKSLTLPTARRAVRWINDNTVEVTILENGNPLQTGLKYIAYRQ